MPGNQKLRYERELRGWSQARVAKEIGTTPNSVSMWERGLVVPTPYFRERLCTLFEKNAVELGLFDAEMSEVSTEETQPLPTLSSPGVPASMRPPLRYAEAAHSIPYLAQHPATTTGAFHKILQSAVKNQQAYTLWQLAFVSALKNRSLEAHKLGAESLQALQQLSQEDLVAIQQWMDTLQAPPPGGGSASSPENPPGKQPLVKRMKKGIARHFRMSILLIALLCFASILMGIQIQQYSHTNTSRSTIQPARSSPLATFSSQCSLSTSTTSLSNAVGELSHIQVAAHCPLLPSSLQVVWGDGITEQLSLTKACSASCLIMLEHTYTTAGTYKTTIIFQPGRQSLSLTVRIAPLTTASTPIPTSVLTPTPTAPAMQQASSNSPRCFINGIPTAQQMVVGAPIYFQVSANCVSPQSSIKINWGDGTSFQSTFATACTDYCETTLEHVYQSPGNYTVIFTLLPGFTSNSIQLPIASRNW